jgi:hypothetical protein
VLAPNTEGDVLEQAHPAMVKGLGIRVLLGAMAANITR